MPILAECEPQCTFESAHSITAFPERSILFMPKYSDMPIMQDKSIADETGGILKRVMKSVITCGFFRAHGRPRYDLGIYIRRD